MANRDIVYGIRITANSASAVAETKKVDKAFGEVGAALGKVVVEAEKAESSLSAVVSPAAQTGLQAEASALGVVAEKLDQVAVGAGKAEASLAAVTSKPLQGVQAGSAALGATAERLNQVAVGAGKAEAALGAAATRSVQAASPAAVSSLGATAGQLDRVGVSAGQTAQALRQLPMQFSDIVVSLQAGQSPMQVLLQQGSQIKDQFGGIGPAAQAMGGYIAGLVGPFTIAAGAVAGLALAYYQGSEESTRFATGLVLTGNVVGKTVGELSDMAKTISVATHSTQAFAADALSQVISTGAIAAENVGMVTEAAVRMERATGQSVGETIKQFVELGKEPVKASEKLNETANYLTADLYKQIRALAEHGKASDAAALAQKGWADALNERTTEITQNLGHIEAAWGGVIQMAKAGWDAVLGVGRTQSRGERIAELEQKAAPGRGIFAGLSADEKVELAGLKATVEAEQKAAKAAADRAAHTAAIVKWKKDEEQYRSNDLKREQAIAQVRQDGLNAKVSEEEIEKRIALIREKYKDPVQKKAAKSPGESIEMDWTRRLAVLQAEAGATTQLTETERAAVKVMTEFAQGKLKLTAAEKARLPGLVQEALLLDDAAEAAKKAKVEQEALAKAQEAAIAAVRADTQALLAKLDAAQFEAETYGMTEEAVYRLLAARAQDRAEMNAFGDANDAVIAELKAQAKAYLELADAAGAKASREAVRKAGEDARASAQRFSDDLERALTDSLMRSFEAGKGFGEAFLGSIKNMLKTAALKAVVQVVLSPLTGGISGVAGAGMSSSMGGASSLMGTASNISTLSNLAGYGAIGYQWATGSMSGANAAGTVAANATGSGLDGLIASTNGWGTVAADAGGSAAGMSGLGLAGGALGGAMLGYQLGGGNALGTFAGGAGGIAAYGAGASAMAGGSLAAGASAALAAVPVWGWIALAALALGGSMVTGGTPHLGGAYVAGTDGTGFKADNANYSNFGLDWGAYNSDRNAGMDGATKSLAEGIAGSLGGILGKFGLDNYYQVGVRFASDGEDRSPGAIRITNQAGEIVAEVAGKFNKSAQKGLEELAAKAGEAIQKTLLDADLPTWAEDTLKALGDTPTIDQLNTALASISQFEITAGAITDAIGISTEAVYGLTKAFGGLSAAGAALSNYYQLFYSDAERMADARAQLADQFGALGQTMPESKAAFRGLVESIDTTTTAGQQLYAQLIALAGPFAAVTDAAASASAAIAQEAAGLQMQIWQLTGDAASIRAAELEQIDPANRALQERVWALEDEARAVQAAAEASSAAAAASRSLADAWNTIYSTAAQSFSESSATMLSSLEKSAQRERTRLTAARDAASEAVTSVRSVLDLLSGSLSSLYGSVDATAAMQAADAMALISGAASKGFMPSREELSAAISAAQGGFSGKVYASQIDADRDRLVLAGQLSKIQAAGAAQLPVAERALKAATDQLTALEASVELYRDQLDELRGIRDLSVDLGGTIEDVGSRLVEALRAQAASFAQSVIGAVQAGRIGTAAAAGQLAGAGVATDQFSSVGGQSVYLSSKGALYTSSDNMIRTNNGWAGSVEDARSIVAQTFATSSPADFYAAAVRVGLSGAMIEEMYQMPAGTAAEWAKANNLPAFAVGTDYVPNDMLALVHQGERITPAPYSGQQERLLEALVAEVQSLRATLAAVAAETRRAADAVNGNPDAPMLVETV